MYSLKRGSDKPIFTVWDGGGNDTLDFSGFTQNQTINLKAEAFSDVGGLRGNVSVAKGVMVENAIGNRHIPAQAANIGTYGGQNPTMGSHFLGLLIHELGHTLGLSHPGQYDGQGFNYGRNAEYAQDTKARSVMSYWDETHQPGHNFARLSPAAPMMDDIAAAQRLYGANTKTRNTDTTYGFNSNSGREVYSLKRGSDKPIFTVWDGGGNDTLDFSGFTQNQTINLKAEAFSDVGGLRGNVSVAKGVMVENAIGNRHIPAQAANIGTYGGQNPTMGSHFLGLLIHEVTAHCRGQSIRVGRLR